MKTKEIITTITKEKFSKLSPEKKRIAVAKDVLDRIELKQLKPNNGIFCRINKDPLESSYSLKEKLQNTKTKCEVCAKGGLFLSYIGIVNEYEVYTDSIHNGENLYSREMKILSKIFKPKQLSLIETAFEGTYYSDWNKKLTKKEITDCINFRGIKREDENRDYLDNNYKTSLNILTKICENIIKNNGDFIPSKSNTNKQKMTIKNLDEIVNNYPTKNKEGFTHKETKSLLKEYSIDAKKFFSSMGVNTVMVIDGETISYHTDIKRALRIVLNGKESSLDWD